MVEVEMAERMGNVGDVVVMVMVMAMVVMGILRRGLGVICGCFVGRCWMGMEMGMEMVGLSVSREVMLAKGFCTRVTDG